jgi:dihydrofolate reductase
MALGRKIIVYIATSADGFIARPDGDVKWLDRPRVAGDYGMGAFFRTIDTILWGRKTYDKSVEFGQAGGGSGSGVRNYVFTRHPPDSSPPGIVFVNEPIDAFSTRLRSGPGKNIWMMGGGQIIAAFLDEGQIDELMIFVIPVFIGEGIPLLAPRHRQIPLKLLSSRRYSDGVVRLHYRVARSAGERRRPPRRKTSPARRSSRRAALRRAAPRRPSARSR